MLSRETAAQAPHIQIWPIERLVEYPRNLRKNDAAVDRMRASIREFTFKVHGIELGSEWRKPVCIPKTPSLILINDLAAAR